MLSRILADLITQAEKKPGFFFLRKLQSGLFVFMRYQESAYTMTLSRDRVRPGIVEMKTCISNLPTTIQKPKLDEAINTVFNQRPSIRVDFFKETYVQTSLLQDFADHG